MTTHLPMVRDSYERPDVCGACGGSCCKNLPGVAMPEDFGAPDVEVMRAKLTERLKSGRWAIDWWEGDVTGHDMRGESCFVRPATVDNEWRLRDPSYGGVCTFLTPGGCGIFEERPAGCRGLEPDLDGDDCVERYGGKREAALAWIAYEDLLDDVAEDVRRSAR